MRFFDNDYDDIMVPEYAEHLKSDTFNSLTIEQQNEELKRTVIALSNDFEKIVRIMLGIQDNLRDVTEWMDQDIHSSKVSDTVITNPVETYNRI